ncbi:MAG: DUF362 domain-containing protein, partial [Proteobacteria bacterium]|nr:DUF362 domain-containing protein [Pseudomonadota bacterium]
GVRYHQMALGEAATATSATAGYYSMMMPDGSRMTTEAVIEGKSGDFYGGWGFYFARRYLSESLESGASDDPMKGHAESVDGTYFPPGLAGDRLMVYDLNRISEDPSRGREIELADGVNYKSIVLHKAIVGGDPQDSGDMEAYPGCILVNVPKFKVHMITLFTNVIKNLGIGLYPMQYAGEGGCKWDYSVPHVSVPGMKGGIPHEIWVPELDHERQLPKEDADGNCRVKKTGGINATMIDIVKAAASQDVFMIHVVDGIETTNLDHTGSPSAVGEPEGMAFAGLDPVATDLLCARYMFSNVPLAEAAKVDLDDGSGGRFPQAVPVPRLDGGNIVTETGYDCPLSRDNCLKRAEERGLGTRGYYVVGRDAVADLPMVSLQGHLGVADGGVFSDRVTKTLFYDSYKVPWDLQKTSFGYLEALDALTGSSLKDEFLNAFDDDHNGIVSFDEYGKKGIWGAILYSAGQSVNTMATERLGYLKPGFTNKLLKYCDSSMNPDGGEFYREFMLGVVVAAAYKVSQLELEMPDPFQPDLTFGMGKWPSFETARFMVTGNMMFGAGFPMGVEHPSFYTQALLYADLTQNGGQYAGEIWSQPDNEKIGGYFSQAVSGEIEPLDFTVYVPAGFETLSGNPIPNVEATDNPAKVFTASFAGGKEIW